MKPLVIYHANCADGFGAAFAAWLKLGDEAEYLPMHYGDSSPDFMAELCRNRETYILDFSFKKLVMEHIFKAAKRVVWLDHHLTSKFDAACFTELEQNHLRLETGLSPAAWPHTVMHSDNKSGAMLAWEYFHPGTEVPMLIKHIDDYDRWQFKLEGTKAFNKALWSYAPWDFLDWNRRFIYADGRNQYKRFIEQGEAILRAHDQNVQAVVKGASRMCEVPVLLSTALSTSPIVGLSANCPPHLTSDVGHELATQSGTFGLCWCLGKEGTTAQCSLRSNGEYDVSAIAKAFGGGGHRNAAGFQVDIQTLLGWLK